MPFGLAGLKYPWLSGYQKRTAMPRTDTMEIETTAADASAELARRGVGAEERVVVFVVPDDWLARARAASREKVIAAGLSDEDIDRLIEEAREEVHQMKK